MRPTHAKPALALLVLSLLCAPALSQTAPVPPAPAPDASGLAPGRIVLPEKTEINLTLDKDLKSGADKAGEVVHYEVERDVFSPFPAHVLLIPAGAGGFGKVTRSSRRGMLGKSGKLEFSCDYVQAPDGTKVQLRTEPTKERGRNNTGASVAVAVLAAPIALLMNGRDVTVHKGQEFVAYVDQDTALADPKGGAAEVLAAPPVTTSPAMETPVSRPSAPTLFTLGDGSQVAGTIKSFDGTTYVVTTATGDRNVDAASVKSMQALPGK